MAIRKSEMLFTIGEYLTIERHSEDRHEFLDGYIFAMAGESGRHADISTNLTTTISTQLRNTPCRARAKDTKVHSGPVPRPNSIKGFFSYPDLVVICGEPLYHDEHQDVVMNPAVIFEVLSESTESFDRGEKFQRYQIWNPTLSDYVLVSQTRPVIEHYARQADGSWSYRIFTGLESRLEIATIHCELPLAEVYDRITFPPSDIETVM
jgi:Uma2 family endonuclease